MLREAERQLLEKALLRSIKRGGANKIESLYGKLWTQAIATPKAEESAAVAEAAKVGRAAICSRCNTEVPIPPPAEGGAPIQVECPQCGETLRIGGTM